MLKLKELRKEKNLTQKQVADKLCVSESTVCLYEKGQRTPSIDTLVKYTFIYDCTLEDLVV